MPQPELLTYTLSLATAHFAYINDLTALYQ
jgi:hypothetical protein